MNDKTIGTACLVAHIVLGLVGFRFPIIITAWLGCVVVFAVLYSARDKNKAGLLHVAAAYLCSYELLARFTYAPGVPSEVGKYLGILLLTMGIAFGRKFKTLVPGLILMGLLLPPLILTDFSRDVRDTLVANWLGAFVLALSVMYFHRRVIMEKNMIWILRALAAPALTVAICSTMKSQDIGSIDWGLEANRDATGYGANQVATIYGLGIVALSVAFFMGRPLFGFATCDFCGMIYLFFRGLISFSRGGLISAVIAAAGALAVILWAYSQHQNIGQTTRLRRLLLVPIIVPALGVIFLVTDQLTGGMLLQRYRGETMGTLHGDREKTIDVITSGRSNIVMSDLLMWRDHLFLGVGPGNSKEMRPQYGYRRVAPHTEYSRLVAEQGLFGFFFCCAILIMPLMIVMNPGYPVVGRALLAALALFSLTVMAHSATRLFCTTFVYGIGWAIIVPKDVLLRLAVNHPVLRKRLTKMLGLRRPELILPAPAGN
ncbi:MAG: O-antigen ligase family protein [Verrucomicrobiales bacterium]